MKLHNEHVFVTGGAAGIGAAIVLDAVQQGAKVSFCDINVPAGVAYAAEDALLPYRFYIMNNKYISKGKGL
jgi:NAD(P)-dependent dehydrogenase (short-subunit alcohol dehydrogenase family)